MLELARLAIAARPGTVLDEAEAALERLGAGDRAEIDRDAGDRRLVDLDQAADRRWGSRCAIWCRTAVAELIAERGLYREAVAA